MEKKTIREHQHRSDPEMIHMIMNEFQNMISYLEKNESIKISLRELFSVGEAIMMICVRGSFGEDETKRFLERFQQMIDDWTVDLVERGMA